MRGRGGGGREKKKKEVKMGDSLPSLLHPPSPKISSPLTLKEDLTLSLFKDQ